MLLETAALEAPFPPLATHRPPSLLAGCPCPSPSTCPSTCSASGSSPPLPAWHTRTEAPPPPRLPRCLRCCWLSWPPASSSPPGWSTAASGACGRASWAVGGRLHAFRRAGRAASLPPWRPTSERREHAGRHCCLCRADRQHACPFHSFLCSTRGCRAMGTVCLSHKPSPCACYQFYRALSTCLLMPFSVPSHPSISPTSVHGRICPSRSFMPAPAQGLASCIFLFAQRFPRFYCSCCRHASPLYNTSPFTAAYAPLRCATLTPFCFSEHPAP